MTLRGNPIQFVCSLLAISVLASLADAGEPEAKQSETDKSGFSLFNPTPSKLLREMTTDGHGASETPYTVDAGHFQLELILVRFARDTDAVDGQNFRREAWGIAPLLLKAGLFNPIDLELALEPYNIVHERLGTNSLTGRGFGDTTVRLKANIWGNDGGRTAFAVMPFLTLPTRDKDLGESRVEGGLILPFSLRLADASYMDLTGRIGRVWNEEQRRYETEFSQSISFGDFFGRNLFAYVEFFSAVSADGRAPWVGTFDAGLIYRLSDNIQLSAGVNIGVTRSADDWSPFIGAAWRY